MEKEKEQEVIKVYTSGNSIRQTSTKIGISATQVRRILNKNNIASRSNKTDQDIEKKIIELYNNGESSEKIADIFNINGTTVCRILKRNNISIRSPEENKRKFEIKKDFFENIDTEEKAYLLGFLYANGTIHSTRGVSSLVLKNDDYKILLKFSELIYGNKNHVIINDYSRFVIYSKKIKSDLIKHGCTPKKSFTLKIPELQDHLMNHFLRGVFDGDGCYYLGDKKISISLIGSKIFITQIRDYLMDKLNIVGSLSSSKGSDKIYNIYYSKRIDLFKLIKYIYNDATIFLERKYKKSQDILNSIHDARPVFYTTKNILKYQNERLTARYIKSLDNDKKLEVAEYVFNYFRTNGFPYPKYSSEELRNEFSKLESFKSNINSRSLIGNKIIYHFCKHFFSVRGPSLPSMVEAFYDDERLMNTIKNRMGITYKETFSITGNMIRQGFRNSYNSFATSFFKPILAKSIYEKYAKDNADVLDISAGFGQRMLGACTAKNVRSYTGLDPWTETFESLNDMKSFLDLKNVTLYNIGSEKFITDKRFDFCFSSPPFFNKEIYSDNDSQAYINRSFNEFLYNWWVPTSYNIYNVLHPGSCFVLNMDLGFAKSMVNVVSEMFELTDTFNIEYLRKNLGKSGSESYFVLKRRVE